MDTFNLLAEPWIPVLRHNGTAERLGILETLQQAGQIRQLAAPNPMDRVALLRFLLAVLYWCQGNPPEAAEKERIFVSGQFPGGWFAKLIENSECFNLLGDAPRFYQDKNAERTRPATDLLQEVPTGNNFWHFRHSTDSRDGLCPSCCAMGLLRLPLFSVSGRPDLKAAINGKPPIYVVRIAQSLAQAILLNWVPRDHLGVPVWEQRPAQGPDGIPTPILSGLTALSRRVSLHPPTSPAGLCVGCGIEEPALIRTCEYQSAGDQEDANWNDPHVIYQEIQRHGNVRRKALVAPDLTRASFKMDKPWADWLMELVASPKSQCAQRPIDFRVVGFATDKAKNIDVWERSCRVTLTGRNTSDTIKNIRAWNAAAEKIPSRMKPTGSDSRGLEFTVAATAIRPQIESLLSDRISDALAGGGKLWDRATDEHRQLIGVVAVSLAPGFTTRAVERRRRIAESLPHAARRGAPRPRKSNRTTGGGA